jgi:hypothetical protein
MCSLWQPVAPDIALFMLALNVRFWPNAAMSFNDPKRTFDKFVCKLHLCHFTSQDFREKEFLI